MRRPDPERPSSRETHLSALSVARRFLDRGVGSVGLWPVDRHVFVPSLAIAVGRALLVQPDARVAVVDANRESQSFSPDVERDVPDPVGTLFYVRWLEPDLAVFFPKRGAELGTSTSALDQLLRRHGETFTHYLVDLTGTDRYGDHLAAIGLLDGVIIVGHCGRTKEVALLEAHEQLPTAKNLGAVLVE